MDSCPLACLSLCTVHAAACQLHSAHVIVISLQAFFVWHHSKDCIQVQHNFTRYKEEEKLPSTPLKKPFLSAYDLQYSCLHLISLYSASDSLNSDSIFCIMQEPSRDLTRPILLPLIWAHQIPSVSSVQGPTSALDCKAHCSLLTPNPFLLHSSGSSCMAGG